MHKQRATTEAISPFFIAIHKPLEDTHDGLRGFEICDPDGYIVLRSSQGRS